MFSIWPGVRRVSPRAPGGGNGAHQRLEVKAAVRAQDIRDAMAAQRLLDYRSDGGYADARENFAQLRLKRGFARHGDQSLDLRRAREGDHADTARD